MTLLYCDLITEGIIKKVYNQYVSCACESANCVLLTVCWGDTNRVNLLL